MIAPRWSARPTFALERLELLDAERVVYRLPKPQRDGTTALTLTPLELIDHLAALIPPPRRDRHRYHGVLAPNSTFVRLPPRMGMMRLTIRAPPPRSPHPLAARPRTLAPRRAISGPCCLRACSSAYR
jgi:hypothetical protein